jgi:hypothetical protein
MFPFLDFVLFFFSFVVNFCVVLFRLVDRSLVLSWCSSYFQGNQSHVLESVLKALALDIVPYIPQLKIVFNRPHCSVTIASTGNFIFWFYCLLIYNYLSFICFNHCVLSLQFLFLDLDIDLPLHIIIPISVVAALLFLLAIFMLNFWKVWCLSFLVKFAYLQNYRSSKLGYLPPELRASFLERMTRPWKWEKNGSEYVPVIWDLCFSLYFDCLFVFCLFCFSCVLVLIL